jgi:hypothetical protein
VPTRFTRYRIEFTGSSADTITLSELELIGEPAAAGIDSPAAEAYVSVPGGFPAELLPGESVDATLGVSNQSSRKVTAEFAVDGGTPLQVTPATGTLTAAPGARATTTLTVTVPEGTPAGVHEAAITVRDARTRAVIGTVKVTVKVPTPAHSGRWMYYSGKRDNMSATLTRTVQVPAAGSTSMDAWLLYATESGFDYIYGEVSTDGGATWQQVGDRLDGSSGGWRKLSWSLDAYAGQEVQFRLRYTTDGGVLEEGVYADDFSLVNGGQVIWSDDVESDDAGWTIAEFTKVDHSPLDG